MEDKAKKKTKRLVAEIPPEIFQQLKYISIIRNCTIRKLVLRALMGYIKYEEKFN